MKHLPAHTGDNWIVSYCQYCICPLHGQSEFPVFSSVFLVRIARSTSGCSCIISVSSVLARPFRKSVADTLCCPGGTCRPNSHSPRDASSTMWVSFGLDSSAVVRPILGERWQGTHILIFALLAGGGSALWMTFVARPAVQYLWPQVRVAVQGIARVATRHQGPSHQLFHSAAGLVAPRWVQIVGIAAACSFLLFCPGREGG
jgi:hypothetical protein